jgi:potassium uptake TrkH family protein
MINPVSTRFSPETRQSILRVLDRILLVGGLAALVILVQQVGWPSPLETTVWLYVAARFLLAVYIVQGSLRLLIHPHPLSFVLKHKFHFALFVLAWMELAFSERMPGLLRLIHPGLSTQAALLLVLGLTQIPVLAAILLRVLRCNPIFGMKAVPPGLIFAGSFGAAIAAGTLLLKLPNASAPGHQLGWIDALFTSTSAVCVTGLTVVNTATAFSPLGHTILLLLIQIGGLGIMTLTVCAGLFLGGGATLRARVVMQDVLDESNLNAVSSLVFRIVAFTLLIEAIGAVLLWQSLRSTGLPVGTLVFSSLFHSVSSFCNAGFSLYSAGLAEPFLHDRIPFLSVIAALVVLGGLGFPVLSNLYETLMFRFRSHGVLEARIPTRLTTHTKLVLVMTGLLLAGGTILIWINQHGPWTGAGLFDAFFVSVSARTAGFNTFDTTGLLPWTAFLVILLMFIGASPGGTGGGVKTTCFGVILLEVWRILRGRDGVEIFHRRIPAATVQRAFATLFLSGGAILAASALLIRLEPDIPALDLVFEAVSAFATVGLTRGVTPNLGDPAKLLLVLLMFTGRIGILMLLVALFRRTVSGKLTYPEDNLGL